MGALCESIDLVIGMKNMVELEEILTQRQAPLTSVAFYPNLPTE